jgi:hypothetical protein
MEQKTDKEIEEDESRTTSTGLFNLAEAYRMSGEALMAAKIKTAHAESPVRFLYYHAIELFLKAFLREHGHSAAVLSDPKKFGHKTAKLTARAAQFGLSFSDRDREVLDLMGETDAVIRSRYIRTGPFTWPRVEALSDTCENLRQDIGAALKKAGVTLRL